MITIFMPRTNLKYQPNRWYK